LATVNFETCFDLATGKKTEGDRWDDDPSCPATGIKFPYGGDAPHARTWWSENQGTSAALVNKPFSAITAADMAGATFCNHINDPRCSATSGPRKGRTTFDDPARVGGDWTMILQSDTISKVGFYKVGFISELAKYPTYLPGQPRVNFQYAKLD